MINKEDDDRNITTNAPVAAVLVANPTMNEASMDPLTPSPVMVNPVPAPTLDPTTSSLTTATPTNVMLPFSTVSLTTTPVMEPIPSPIPPPPTVDPTNPPVVIVVTALPSQEPTKSVPMIATTAVAAAAEATIVTDARPLNAPSPVTVVDKTPLQVSLPPPPPPLIPISTQDRHSPTNLPLVEAGQLQQSDDYQH